MNPAPAKKSPSILVALLYFLSGALALVYQVVWARMMVHVFGSTAAATGTVLAAFMTGLAVGSWYIGRIADRSPDCLRLYAWLEMGIALAALVSHLLLDRITPINLAVFEIVGSSSAIYGTARFILAFLLVLGPTILMGATLPVLSRYLSNRHTLVGINLSTLYAMNTFGAVTGVVVTGFFLIGKYGIHVPVYLAIGGNLLVGCVAWLLSTRLSKTVATQPTPEIAEEGTDAKPSSEESLWLRRLVLIGLGISGLTSFAYEIYWTRSLVFILGNSTYALTTMLSAFLTGIGLGGFLVRYIIRHSRDRIFMFGWLQVALGLFSALALPMLFSLFEPQALGQHLTETSDQVLPLVFSGFGVAFLVMLVPATLIGATFPLVGQIAVHDRQKAGTGVGRVYAVNTFGNVLGALLPGFLLLGWLGIQKGIVAMASLNVALGLVIIVMRLILQTHHRAWRIILPLVLLASVAILGQTPLGFQFPSDGEQPHHQTLFYREGPLATTKVYSDPKSNEKHISVDGIVIGGTGFAEYKQLLLAHLPKLLLRDVSTELSVGLGSGILAGESLLHTRVQKLTSVEIEPSVVAGAEWFNGENHAVSSNPRFENITDDIGNFLRTTHGKYQVITADEKTADEYASNGFSYSLEYYDLLKQHLDDAGLVAQWVPMTLPPEQYRIVLRTFTESFEHVQLWHFLPAYKRGPFNTILIGSKQPIDIDYAHMQNELTKNAESYRGLKPYGLTSAQAVIPHYVADEKLIRTIVKDSPLNTLDHPRYEFFYPWDYSIDRQEKIISNHDLVTGLKRTAAAEYLSRFRNQDTDSERIRQSFAAELRYLAGFRQFLKGFPVADQYRTFDGILNDAPWNDSLRAQVLTLYTHFANSAQDPYERARRQQRVDALYQDGANPHYR